MFIFRAVIIALLCSFLAGSASTPRLALAAEPETILVEEVITVTDTVEALPPVVIAVSEVITITDAPQLSPVLSILVEEVITVTDTVEALPPVVIALSEDITVTDSPQLLPGVLLFLVETINVMDSPMTDIINSPPVANDDDITTPEDTPVNIQATANDTDVDSNLDPSTAAVTTGPSNGTAMENGDGTFTYTPDLDWYGVDQFEYEICDTDGLCDTAVVNIQVIPRNIVTDNSFCTFDLDKETEGDQFKLIFTPDNSLIKAFKLSASNPGQFLYNLYYPGGGEVEITLPYPFITSELIPITFYDSVAMSQDGKQLCFTPGNLIGNSDLQVILGDGYSVSLVIEIPVEASFATLHLDYGLKGSLPYINGGVDFIDAIGDGVITADINNLTLYEFTANLNGVIDNVEIENINSFKRIAGIGGLVVDSGTMQPIEGASILVTNSTLNISHVVYTDEDGWYMWNFKHKGKESYFYITVSADGYNNAYITVLLKANKLVVLDFILSLEQD